MRMIKNFLAAFTAVAVMSTSMPSYSESEENDADICTAVAATAEELMSAHQDGMPLSTILEVYGKYDGYLKPVIDTMIEDAYSETRWRSEESQQRAIGVFRDYWHLACIKWQRESTSTN
ncbi:hypothetical protein [Zobellella sp. DQSA1]|uniref:hypothetical protein n=1 Tax=Zobellella sp. DQSA1 TaxID=3342386 RepID=UPI0035C1D30E